VVDDGDTKWTFVIDQPFARRTFQLASPTGGTLRSGDTATARLDVASGSLTNARVFASTGVTQYFKVDETNGLVIAGTELQFTVPTVSAANTTLSMAADVELRVDRCDAPLGCKTQGVVSGMQPIVLAP
jgi:hypothetical protein